MGILEILIITFVIVVIMLIRLSRNKTGNSLYKLFKLLNITLLIHVSGNILQLIFKDSNIAPIYFDYITYFGGVFTPVVLLFISLKYKNDNIKIKNLLWTAIVPIISLLVLWTNDIHHLFYIEYSTIISEGVVGPYFNIYSLYTYALLFIALIILIRTSLNKSGFFSLQTAFIILGVSIPVLASILGTFKIINMSIYITPITFILASFCFYIAIFKLKALNVIPVAVKTIMDTMTDSFIVISKDGTIADINKTCIEKFAPLMELKQNDNLYEKLEGRKTVKLSDLKGLVKEAIDKKGTVTTEYHIVKGDYDRYFEIDVQPIKAKSGNEYVASLLLIRDITKAKRDMEIMTKNENLVILGELAGGVAHDINTPIAAIKNGIMMLKDTVPTENEKMLLTRMDSCADKIINLVNSMRNQIRNIGSDEKTEVNISAVVNDTLMIVHNETMKKGVKINLNIKDELKVMGNATKLGQVVTNLVMNAIQAYEDKPGMIDIDVYKSDKNEAIILVEDYAGGIPEHIRPHIFKNILTTKGVAGTGFGLYLAYSVIKGAFGGDMHFETETGKGTKFVIRIPLK